MVFFLKGIILGFSIAAPVGPIGVLCIRKTLQFGRLSGLFSGLGAAIADTFYGIIAAFGLTAISTFLLDYQLILKTFGGFFLIYLGIKTFFNKSREDSYTLIQKTLFSDFLSTFFLTITNPMTIFSYIAVFAGLGICHTASNYVESSVLVSGVFLGSMLWWFLLSEIVATFRKKISEKMMSIINKIAGILIIIFGITALITCI